MRDKITFTIRNFARVLSTFAVAAVLTAVAASGWLTTLDGIASDAFYQRPEGTDGEIVVIGIDQRALEELGPLPWPRSYMAEAIEYLNSDPDARPDVIGVDVLYIGESDDSDADQMLVDAASEYGNVVFAAAATFGSEVVEDADGSFRLNDRAVTAWDQPFDALMESAKIGQINASMDEDGIIRHAMLWLEIHGKGRVYSFSRVIYTAWCEANGYVPLNPPGTNDSGTFFIPFTEEPGGYYEEVSIVDLVNGDIDSDYFAGKIVLIGPYAAGLQDEYVTAVEHAKTMYGIEIQANLIDAFRKGEFPAEVQEMYQLFLLFALCALLFLVLWDVSLRYAVTVWAIVCGSWFAACSLLYHRGYVFHILWVPLFGSVLFVVSIISNYLRAAREKRHVQNTFKHYVDPTVMRQLLERGDSALELGGTMTEIAVLFVDIRGFTTMSEALDPPTVVEIINKYLSLTTECIMKNHGTLDKFVGDCTMAFWNAPLPQDDAVYLACRAAMDMVEGSKALGEELMERFGRTVSFGIGVNWGPAVVGNIGASMRMDYTAIGDTVNTASRLEANASGGKILISRAVADILGDRAMVTSLGDSIKLKGKAEGFEILTLDKLR